MKFERGSATASGTTPFTMTVLFNDSTLDPDYIELSTVAPAGGSSSDLESGEGSLSATQQQAKQLYADRTIGERSEQVNNKCLIHYRNVSGSITKTVEAARSASSLSTAGQFSIDLSVLTANHQIYFKAWQW